MKRFLITALITLAILSIIFFIFVKEDAPSTETLSVPEYFTYLVHGAIMDEYGYGVEGWEPAMILNVFPNAINQDFHGVSTDFGEYLLMDGGLSFAPTDPEGGFKEEMLYINQEGMQMFMKNAAGRLNVPSNSREDIENLSRYLYQQDLTPTQ